MFSTTKLWLKTESGVELIAYAGDLAIVETDKSAEQLENKPQYAVNSILTT